MKLSSKQYNLGFLASEYESADFALFVSDDSLCYLSCIVCYFETAVEVVSNWKAIQNLVSGYYQPSGELAMWNIYLMFFCMEELSVWDKYVIQNDKYAVRKVVLDGMDKFPDRIQTEFILNNHLLGEDLQLKKKDDQTKLELYLSMAEYVHGTPLDSTSNSREKRAEIINNIIELLNKNENKKS